VLRIKSDSVPYFDTITITAARIEREGAMMTYALKPLACDPARIKGMSERLIVSHYENNYGGAVNRLNAITAQLVELDFATAPGFVINGLKREELIAMNSMCLQEVFFASLGDESVPEVAYRKRSSAILVVSIAGRPSFQRWAKRSEAGRAGSCSPAYRAPVSSSISGRWITQPPSPVGIRSSPSTCTSIPITSITGPTPPPMSMPS
jgi:hypothetical protein